MLIQKNKVVCCFRSFLLIKFTLIIKLVSVKSICKKIMLTFNFFTFLNNNINNKINRNLMFVLT